MASINEIITTRIRQRLEETGQTARAASIRATGKPDAIRTILTQGVMPSAERLDMIAVALDTSTAYLLGATEDSAPIAVRLVDAESNRVRHIEPSRNLNAKLEREHVAPILPRRTDMPKDIPVYGTAIGSSEDIEALENGKVAVEQTTLNTGDVIDYFRRPPGLANSRKAYGLYVAGFSMEPAYEPGSVIIVDPSRPPSAQDFVVVYMRGKEDEDSDGDPMVSAVLLKRLVRRSASFVELEQYNPPARFRVGADTISEMHRVLPLAEIVGV
ncbi:XRE family transcriptional regulator [Sphingomonas aquatilis]